jgi:2-haloacid dehalogenase
MLVSNTLSRRSLLTIAAAGVATGIAATLSPAYGASHRALRAVAFDAFTTFDTRPVEALAEQLFPGNGGALTSAWRTRQFEYTWLRTLSRSYVDFWQVTEQALVMAAKLVQVTLTPEKSDRLLQGYLEIKAWPDAAGALRHMKGSGLKLAFLANATPMMLDTWVKNSGLEGIFEPHLSTDQVRAFKPDPRAYQMGIDAFALGRDEILFAAFGGWDAAGAKAFGYPCFWVNRAGVPQEELGFKPDGVGSTLRDLESFLAQYASNQIVPSSRGTQWRGSV